ncbi:rho GTPase-activating protein 12 isoform X7 [Neophocaena asiaeorientalis asiaeorientalis]|uniref:Rho GTPase-activating protein 12 isoform X7 n=1 Tax=Neophocaena asiaeorientalis asiaeorientalis TaxID=1706337 RepID=A0A341BSV7_NEOAA|nr:rho GTPase-activating protein 12 isoform X7 [Neophocaena asiaeorientalis asiaeorientalis]
MADRGGKIVPGQVYIEVEYDYEYEAKDRKVVIKQGERYILVKKTNDDWWQVKLDENSKAFYVPAQYVREVGRRALMPPVKQAAGLPNHSVKTMQSLHLQRSTENVNKLPELSSFGKPSPSVQGTGLIRDANQNFGPSYIPGQTVNLSLDLTHNNGKFNSDSHSPKVSGQNRTRLFGHFPGPEFLDVEKAGFSQEQSCDSAEGSERIHHDSESGDELSSSSTEQIRWLKHVDDQGRQYYCSAAGSRSEWELPKESPTASKPCYPENESSPSSPKNQDTASSPKGQEKYGLLNVTKITENGKKVRKNWLSSWAVLQGSSLLFTKTQGSSTSWFGSNQSKPEFTVDLKGATIEMASKDKSSKKNVFELKTRQGTELLIQSDNDAVINEWVRVLSSTTSNQTVEPDEAIEEDIPDSPGIEKHDKEKDHKDLKKSRSTKVSSIDSSEQKKTKKNLKKFLTRRPTLQAVREKGYIKDQVFGANLANLCQRENGTVPKFVKLCIEHVEQCGLDVDGIYRVSGNLAVIQKLRFTVNHDEKLDLKDSKWEDIHVITGALKMFFRELPEPLFTFNHFNDFVNAIKQEPRQRVSAVKDLIKQLPKPNQDTMQTLFRHLKRVIENGEKNRMTYQSIAIVFGPTLLKPEKETGNIAVHTVYQNQIVELILLEVNSIFGR